MKSSRLLPLLPLLALAACHSSLDSFDLFSECNTNEAEPIGWDAETDVGTSAARAFQANTQTCTAQFSWDAAPFQQVSIEPPSGRSAMTVEMVVDRQSARIERPLPSSGASCQPRLAADADVHLATDDGLFEAKGRVLLVHDQVRVWALNVKAKEHEGSLKIGDELRSDLAYLLDSVGERCAGRIIFNERPGIDGRAITDILGVWSNGR